MKIIINNIKNSNIKPNSINTTNIETDNIKTNNIYYLFQSDELNIFHIAVI